SERQSEHQEAHSDARRRILTDPPAPALERAAPPCFHGCAVEPAAQVVGQLAAGRVSVVRLVSHRLETDRFQVAWQARPQLARTRELLGIYLFDDRVVVRAGAG